ncbi:Monoterpene epsilon-lactone hydrolase [Nocardioides dokdonensis FR1436]|uniref:Monoterpene epsilon-lactone hydrolase n=1 Tax=Nocardioides dokdonensis FR1436 TaxID=1300347 RepID=A0A1A9GKV6_9ACTN|nr:alpha/beta hydrolase [Nocardioides dokdonensis]ANH38085.1 Monoterpene epsilon-lactone hydrolase [Nocardioides dokdonensis FR1436]
MPSLRHDLLALLVPRLRGAGAARDEDSERAAVEACHADLDRSLPTRAVPGLTRRFDHEVDHSAGFPVHVLTRRGASPSRTLLWLHGGGFVSPIDALHVRYVARLAAALDVRVVLPDYPLTPEHTWRDSHQALVDLATGWAGRGGLLLGGDSAGGGLALAVAQTLRDRGEVRPEHLLLISPWVDLTTSSPATSWFDRRDPWLQLSRMRLYARWWAGSADDQARPEVSPALGDLRDLPPTLMFCGSRDLLVPACRRLARRAADAGWDLTYVEEPGAIHVYPLLPGVPEAARAWDTTLELVQAALPDPESPR